VASYTSNLIILQVHNFVRFPKTVFNIANLPCNLKFVTVIERSDEKVVAKQKGIKDYEVENI
jgi:hypothetical protein